MHVCLQQPQSCQCYPTSPEWAPLTKMDYSHQNRFKRVRVVYFGFGFLVEISKKVNF